MSNRINEVVREYRNLIEGVTQNETAAALLVLAAFLPNSKQDELSHEICMGLRKGLFGAAAGDNTSLFSVLEEHRGASET